MKRLSEMTIEELEAELAAVQAAIAAKRAQAEAPASPWDDPTFSLSGKRTDSVYRTRGFIDTATA